MKTEEHALRLYQKLAGLINDAGGVVGDLESAIECNPQALLVFVAHLASGHREYRFEINYGDSDKEHDGLYGVMMAQVGGDRRTTFDSFPRCSRRGRQMCRARLWRPDPLPSDGIWRKEDFNLETGIRGLHPFELLALCAHDPAVGRLVSVISPVSNREGRVLYVTESDTGRIALDDMCIVHREFDHNWRFAVAIDE